MPKYDYRCSECGHVYEKREGFDAPSVQTCPECSGRARRILRPPAIVFKGSGWYVTDSRKGAPSETSSSTSPSPNGSDGKSGTDSKSDGAAKTETASATKSDKAD